MRKKTTLFVLALLFLMMMSSTAVAEWANSTFDRCRTIEISNAGSTTLTNFPMFINVSYDSDMLSDYADIRFYNKGCGSGGSKLDYEIENHTATRAHVWVEIDSIPSTGATLGLYYKNNSVVSSESNSNDTFSNNFDVVAHLSDGDSTASYFYQDATVHNNDGTKVDGDGDSESVDSVVGRGIDFDDGDADRIWFNNHEEDNYANKNWTMSIWGYWTDDDSTTDTIMAQTNVAGTGRSWLYIANGDNTYYTYIAGSGTSFSTTADLNDWDFIVMLHWEHNNTIQFFKDGVYQSSISKSMENCGGDHKMGTTKNNNQGYGGTLDEFRLSPVDRSADWINMTYQHIINQESFVTIGDEIRFVSPTPSNGSSVNDTVEINISFESSDLSEFVYNWNGTNYTVLDDSLIMYWNLNNNTDAGEGTNAHVDDFSSFTNDGVCKTCSMNNASCQKDRNCSWNSGGYHGIGIEFDGVDDYIELEDDLVELDNAQQWTFMVWLYDEDTSGYDSHRGVFSRGLSGQRTPWVWGNIGQTYITIQVETNNSVADCQIIDGGSPADNAWSHYAVVFDSLNAHCTAYFNGAYQGTDTVGQDAKTGVENYDGVIGNIYNFGYWKGRMDDIRIYNRSLTADEVAQAYMSTLRHYDSDKYNYYVNQSLNATDTFPTGNYTAYGAMLNNDGVTSTTETRTFSILETGAAADPCTPPASGDWNLACSENCQWTTSLSIPANLNLSGTGTMNLTNTMTFTAGANQYIFISAGCTLLIGSGGEIIG